MHETYSVIRQKEQPEGLLARIAERCTRTLPVRIVAHDRHVEMWTFGLLRYRTLPYIDVTSSNNVPISIGSERSFLLRRTDQGLIVDDGAATIVHERGVGTVLKCASTIFLVPHAGERNARIETGLLGIYDGVTRSGAAL